MDRLHERKQRLKELRKGYQSELSSIHKTIDSPQQSPQKPAYEDTFARVQQSAELRRAKERNAQQHHSGARAARDPIRAEDSLARSTQNLRHQNDERIDWVKDEARGDCDSQI